MNKANLIIRIGFNKAKEYYYFVVWNEEMQHSTRLPSKIKNWDAAKAQADFYLEFFNAKDIVHYF